MEIAKQLRHIWSLLNREHEFLRHFKLLRWPRTRKNQENAVASNHKSAQTNAQPLLAQTPTLWFCQHSPEFFFSHGGWGYRRNKPFSLRHLQKAATNFCKGQTQALCWQLAVPRSEFTLQSYRFCWKFEEEPKEDCFWLSHVCGGLTSQMRKSPVPSELMVRPQWTQKILSIQLFVATSKALVTSSDALVTVASCY